MTSTLLITTLAAYQTRFWIPVARHLGDVGYRVVLLAFDDRSAEMCEAEGVACRNVYRLGLAEGEPAVDDASFSARAAALGIENVTLLFSHERITFGIRDTALLRRRFSIYARALERILDEEDCARATMIQELGGFLSVIASFHAARSRGVENLFIEPSFFRGRYLLTPGSFAAPQIMGEPASAASEEVLAYVAQARASRAIVIPEKDRHHYAAAFKKVLNARNAVRLAEKVWDKAVLGKHQEFGHNIGHALAHARMARNALALKRAYRPFGSRPFVYYPLHVPADMALTIRSPEYLDQLATIDFLLRTIPQGYDLVVKEHPAQIGAIDPRWIRALARRYDTFVLLPPTMNNFEVLSRASAVVTVNSKSGAEALMLGTPVVVTGDAFYTTCPLVVRADGLGDAPRALRRALSEPVHAAEEAALYFETAWRRSRPGELYTLDPARIATFAASLVDALPRVHALQDA